MEIKTNCCGKEMFRQEEYFNGEDFINFVCLECGHIINICDRQLDEEELENYKDIKENTK